MHEIINTGAAPDDGTGDTARDAFTKTNNNFHEIFERQIAAGLGLGGGGTLGEGTIELNLNLIELSSDLTGGEATDLLVFLDASTGFSAKLIPVQNLVANLDLSGGGGAAFDTVTVAGQSDVEAGLAGANLALAAGANVTLATDPLTKTVTIAASGTLGYALVQNSGSGLTARGTLNFPGGALVAIDDAANSRTNITLAQTLAMLATLTAAANQGIYFNSTTTAATYALSAFGRTLSGVADAAAARSTLGITTGAPVFQLEISDPQVGQRWTFTRAPGFNGQINTLVHFTNQGTVTMDVEINGTDVTGLDAVAVGSTEGVSTATAANSWTASQRIEANITAVSGGPQRLVLTLRTQVV